MPIRTFCATCKNCNNKYRIRYGVGDNHPQSASFSCIKCLTKIECSIKKLNDSITVDNAEILPEIEREKWHEYKVINVHAELPIEPGHEHDPYYFATQATISRFLEDDISIRNLRRQQYGLLEFTEKWKKNDVILRLYANDLLNEAEEISGKNAVKTLKEISDWFNCFLYGKWELDQQKIQTELTKAKSKEYFIECQRYLRGSFSECMHEIHNGITCYMNCRSNFDKPIFYQKRGDKLPPNTKMMANWDDMKSVYGDLFEVCGNLMHIIAVTNNIIAGRRYDEFQSPGFTLEKYIQSDKANRCNAFAENVNIECISKYYQAWLRNGTHHHKTRFYPHTELIDFRIGKGGKETRRISLSQYAIATNDIFALLLMLGGIYIESIDSIL